MKRQEAMKRFETPKKKFHNNKLKRKGEREEDLSIPSETNNHFLGK